MDMWKPFRQSTQRNAPQAAILFDKFHILRHLGEALDKIRKAEYGRVTGPQRKFIKGQKYVLLSHQENLTNEGRKSLRLIEALPESKSSGHGITSNLGELVTESQTFRRLVLHPLESAAFHGTHSNQTLSRVGFWD
jgi:transposase